MLFKLNLIFAQKIIHTDAYDIKKFNTSIYGCLKLGGSSGVQLRLSYYPSNRIRILTNTFQGFGGPSFGYSVDDTYRPNNKQTNFFMQEIETDIHLIDKNKFKKINIALNWGSDGRTRTLTYTDLNGEARRIFALTIGFQYHQKKEEIFKYNPNYKKDGDYKLLNLTTQEYESFNILEMDNGVYVLKNPTNHVITDVKYYNMLIGFKFKSISANGINYRGYGNKYNDMHLETYATFILPLYHTYLPYVFKSFDDNATPTHYIKDSRISPGFKFGIFHRNSIRNYWCPGFEFGRNPTMAKSKSRGWFVNISLGLSLNFGKIKLLDY